MSKRIILSLSLSAALIFSGCAAPSSSKSAGNSSWKLNSSGVIPVLDREPYDTPAAPEQQLRKNAGTPDDLPF